MTEKRFWILNTLTKYSGIKDGDKLLTFDEVVELLNKQEEQIKELEEKRKQLEKLINERIKEEPHWHNYRNNEGYTAKCDLDMRF